MTVSNVGGSPIGYGTLTDTPGFAASLAIDGATWTGPTNGSATGAGPYTLPTGGRLGPGASHTYAVRITFHYASTTTATRCAATPTPGAGLTNTAALAKADPSDPAVNVAGAAACATPPALPTAGLTTVKSVVSIVDVDKNNRTSVGDQIFYRFVVTNTGSTVLSGLTVNDPRLAQVPVVVSCPTKDARAGRHDHVYLRRVHRDHRGRDRRCGDERGHRDRHAAVPPGRDERGVNRDRAGQPAGITLDKQAGAIVDGDGNGPDAGDTIPYTFTVTNTGTTALTSVVVTDPRLSSTGPVCTVASLAPGTSSTCAAVSYPLTQADVDAGTVRNDARATGTPADGGLAPQATASTTTPAVPRAGALTLVKTAGPVADTNGNGRQDDGDTITYTFTVTNAGARPSRGSRSPTPSSG